MIGLWRWEQGESRIKNQETRHKNLFKKLEIEVDFLVSIDSIVVKITKNLFFVLKHFKSLLFDLILAQMN